MLLIHKQAAIYVYYIYLHSEAAAALNTGTCEGKLTRSDDHSKGLREYNIRMRKRRARANASRRSQGKSWAACVVVERTFK